jgi:PilZ domain
VPVSDRWRIVVPYPLSSEGPELNQPDPPPAALDLALAILPSLPCEVTAVTALSAPLSLRLLAVDRDALVCTPVATEAEERLVIVVSDDRRGAYEIDCLVVPSRDESRRWRLIVDSVRRVKARRQNVRAGVAESAVVQGGPDGAEFDARVVDIGRDGMAFVCEARLAVGDAVSAMLNIGHQSFPVRASVIHARSIGFGRMRVGCQFTAITEEHRRALGLIAVRAPIDRRNLLPIEVLKLAESAAEDTEVSLSGVRYQSGSAPLPLIRYCRNCARITVQHAVKTGASSQWKCGSC